MSSPQVDLRHSNDMLHDLCLKLHVRMETLTQELQELQEQANGISAALQMLGNIFRESLRQHRLDLLVTERGQQELDQRKKDATMAAQSPIDIIAGATTATFHVTPNTAGPRTVSIMTTPALAAPSSIMLTAALAPTVATMTGPTVGTIGFESAVFTVTLDQPAPPGGVTIIPTSSVAGDTFSVT